MKRKGQWNPFFILLIFLVAGGVPVFASSISGTADWVVQEKVQATRPPVRAAMLGDYMREDYLPDAVNWSVYEASYELGQEGGGVEWDVGDLPARSQVENSLESGSGNVFQDYLSGQFSRSICRFDPGRYRFEVVEPEASSGGTEGMRVEAVADQPTSITCWVKGANTTVNVAPPRNYFIPGNRYFLLYQEMTETVPRVQEELQTLQGNTYTGSGSACGSVSEANREARLEAEFDAETAVESEFDSALTGLPDSLRYSTSSVDPSASSSLVESAVESGECDCETVCREEEEVCVRKDEDDNCLETEMQCVEEEEVCESTMYTGAEAEATPTGATADIGIEDTAHEVPTEQGEINLEFLVEDLSFSIG